MYKEYEKIYDTYEDFFYYNEGAQEYKWNREYQDTYEDFYDNTLQHAREVARNLLI